MRRTIPFAFFIMLCMTAVFPFARNKEVTVTGQVHSYGNAPFNYPGIQTDDGRLLVLQASDKEKAALLGTQGQTITVTGTLLSGEPLPGFDGVLAVIRFETE